MQNPKISIIIPVYNTEAFIRKCLNSVLSQTLKDLEIICVDDGSTDGSGEILDQYVCGNSNIRVIHKAHEGLVRARKVGVQAARGKYIGYVDSDDWIEPEMYEALYYIAERYQVDLVSSGKILEKEIEVISYDGFPEGRYENAKLEAVRNQAFFNETERVFGIDSSLCYKIFRAPLLKKVQKTVPETVTNGEDRICTLHCLLEAKSIYILRRAFYHYVYHADSMWHQEDDHYFDKLGELWRALRSLYLHPNFSEKLRIQCELYIIRTALEGMNEHMGFLVSDLVWISPRWLEKLPAESKILLYGAGRLGRTYYRHVMSDMTEKIHISGWVDKNYANLAGYPMRIQAPEYIKEADYDYIVLALTDKKLADEVRKKLEKDFDVEAEKIIWIQPDDIFWDCAETAKVFGHSL